MYKFENSDGHPIAQGPDNEGKLSLLNDGLLSQRATSIVDAWAAQRDLVLIAAMRESMTPTAEQAVVPAPVQAVGQLTTFAAQHTL